MWSFALIVTLCALPPGPALLVLTIRGAKRLVMLERFLPRWLRASLASCLVGFVPRRRLVPNAPSPPPPPPPSPLPPPLPQSGGLAASALHVSRTICRRAERQAFALVRDGEITSDVAVFLNRLSDYLFMAARVAAKRVGAEEVVYKKGREEAKAVPN